MESRHISPGVSEGRNRGFPAAEARPGAAGEEAVRLREGLCRAALLRHAGIFAAAAAAYLLRGAIPVDNRALWILAISALLNLLVSLIGTRPRSGARLVLLSALFGVLGWTALVHVTGGAGSPFVVGFGLEIVLAALTFGTTGISLACSGVVGGLWVQQAGLGFHGAFAALAVQTACLLGTGATMILLSRRWAGIHGHLTSTQTLLRERLGNLERELEEARTLGEVGENVARLTHGLKNAIHGLRGFSRLLEERMTRQHEDPAVLDGLRASADRLEEICRQILSPGPDHESREARCDQPHLRRVIDEAVGEVSRSHPELRWDRAVGDAGFVAPIEPRSLREILLVLLTNAAEATRDGAVSLEARRENGSVSIAIRDGGEPLPAEEIERLFRPGYTTKPQGSGYGLFLARRLAEAHGGSLSARPEPGGMSFTLTLPARDPGGRP